MMTSSELYDAVVAAGIQMYNHESDLYIPVTPATIDLIGEYEFSKNVTQFRSNIDDRMWFDIPFAYQPFWDRRIK